MSSSIYLPKDDSTASNILEKEIKAGFKVKEIDCSLCNSKAELLNKIAKVLEFPSYFGNNWDALQDCLSDLNWRGQEKWLLIFQNFRFVEANDSAILLDIIKVATKEFKEETSSIKFLIKD